MADDLEAKLGKDIWLGGQQASDADRAAFDKFSGEPDASTHPNVFAWYSLCRQFSPAVRAQWQGAKPVAAPKAAEKAPKADKKKAEKKKQEEVKAEVKKDDDDDFDPFADEEEDEEAEKAKMARMKEIAKTAKSYGKVVVAKSIIVWEVKPWGEETDLKELANKILAIEMDGLFWKTEWKKEPIAYGVFKIVIGATIEDDKVSTDIVQEKIESFEDLVQSVDIQAFNKL